MSHTVLIRHGLFKYHDPENQIVNGEEKEVLVERMAFHNQKVTIPRDADYERGVKLGAFWTEEQARAHYDQLGIPAPNLGGAAPAPMEDVEDDGTEVEITELDEDELVEWLMGTGAFDGQSKPNVQEVVQAGQEGGAEFASTLLKAENRASGEAPREGVKQGLEKVMSGAAA